MLIAKHPVRVTCVHPGGIKTAIARNATVADDYDQANFAQFFDKYLARTSASSAADTIIKGVKKNKARVLIGADAIVLDVWVRLVASKYQGVVAGVTKRVTTSFR